MILDNTEYLNKCIHVEYMFISFSHMFNTFSDEIFFQNLPAIFLGCEKRFETHEYIGMITYHHLKGHDDITSISKRHKPYPESFAPICSSIIKINDVLKFINILKDKTFKERDELTSELKIAKVIFNSLYIQNEVSLETNVCPLFFPCYKTAVYTLVHQLQSAVKKSLIPNSYSMVSSTGYKFATPKEFFNNEMNKYETYLIKVDK